MAVTDLTNIIGSGFNVKKKGKASHFSSGGGLQLQS